MLLLGIGMLWGFIDLDIGIASTVLGDLVSFGYYFYFNLKEKKK